MKTVIVFVVAFVLWYFLGAYSSFAVLVDYTERAVFDVLTDSVEDVYDEQEELYEWDIAGKLQEQKEELINDLYERVYEMQDNISQIFRDYIREKFENIFWE